MKPCPGASFQSCLLATRHKYHTFGGGCHPDRVPSVVSKDQLLSLCTMESLTAPLHRRLLQPAEHQNALICSSCFWTKYGLCVPGKECAWHVISSRLRRVCVNVTSRKCPNVLNILARFGRVNCLGSTGVMIPSCCSHFSSFWDLWAVGTETRLHKNAARRPTRVRAGDACLDESTSV